MDRIADKGIFCLGVVLLLAAVLMIGAVIYHHLTPCA